MSRSRVLRQPSLQLQPFLGNGNLAGRELLLADIPAIDVPLHVFVLRGALAGYHPMHGGQKFQTVR